MDRSRVGDNWLSGTGNPGDQDNSDTVDENLLPHLIAVDWEHCSPDWRLRLAAAVEGREGEIQATCDRFRRLSALRSAILAIRGAPEAFNELFGARLGVDAQGVSDGDLKMLNAVVGDREFKQTRMDERAA